MNETANGRTGEPANLPAGENSPHRRIAHSPALFIVATPIGNLEDITLRALRILKEVDLILCEDKRVTIKLLNKYKIKTKLISFHKFNESKLLSEVIGSLKSGKSIALVSDAGTPLISDPGSSLVKTVIENNIKVISIPGPSSLTAAISLCPFNIKEFLYIGFLPDEKSKRIKTISKLHDRINNVLLFIAPHDLNKYLNEICDVYPHANVFFVRELTKIYEESWSGKIKDLILITKEKKFKGEMVLILNFDSESNENNVISDKNLLKDMEDLITLGISLKETSKTLSAKHNLSSKYLYDLYVKNKRSSS